MKSHLLDTQWQRLPKDGHFSAAGGRSIATCARGRSVFLRHYATLSEAWLEADSSHPWKTWQIPFTCKADLVNTPDNPQRSKDSWSSPIKKPLAPPLHRAAVVDARSGTREARVRVSIAPFFMTSTTGRSADPFLSSTPAKTSNRLSVAASGHGSLRRVSGLPSLEHVFRYGHTGLLAHSLCFDEFGVFTLGTGGGKVMGHGRELRLSEDQADVLIGMPTFLYHVMQHAVEKVSAAKTSTLGARWRESRRGHPP